MLDIEAKTQSRQLPRAARVALRTATLLLLHASILLVLLTLASPSQGHRLSMFAIEPIGLNRTVTINSTSGGGVAQPTPSGPERADNGTTSARNGVRAETGGLGSHVPVPIVIINSTASGPTAVREGGQGEGGPNRQNNEKGKAGEGREKSVVWLGLNGPRIYVGAMKICSQSRGNMSVKCTSASEGAFHAALLPSSLGLVLTKLPSAPRAPILLLVGGTSAVIATMVYLYLVLASLSCTTRRINVIRRNPQLRGHTQSSPRRSVDTLDSFTTLVVGEVVVGEGSPWKSPSEPAGYATNKGGGRRAGPAFLIFTFVSFTLALASSVVELVVMYQAKQRWDDDEAGRAGMQFRIGLLAYLLPCLPILLLLAMITAYIPTMHSRLTAGPAVEEGTEKVGAGEISPPKRIHIDTASRVPPEWTRVTLDGPAEAPVLPAAPPGVSSDPSERTPSARRSWRGIIGVAL